MDEQDKIALVNLILGHLPEKEKNLLERRIKSEPELKKLFGKYVKTIQKLDLFYAYKSIRSKIDAHEFESRRFKLNTKKDNNTLVMKSAGKIVFWLLIMVVIAVVVFWGFFSLQELQQDKAMKKSKIESEKIQLIKEDSVKNALRLKSAIIRRKGTDFTGIALTRSGLYLAPYDWAHEGTILATSKSSTNKIPSTVLWDDKEAGLAILKFANEDVALIKSLPYSFSNKKFFLGEEIVIVAKTNDKIIYNYGRVINDDGNADTLIVKVQLENSILGAPVIDNSGKIIGLVKNSGSNGLAVVQKSVSIFTMISEMNLDKGIDRIYMPANNSLYKLSSPDRIKALSPFLVHFNVRKNQLR